MLAWKKRALKQLKMVEGTSNITGLVGLILKNILKGGTEKKSLEELRWEYG